ncbi:MAG TPA: class I SAM-dependent methyltransferase [Cellulomonas sp.]
MAEEFADGDAYERFMGRWSRLAAASFVAWLDLPGGLLWLDVGCGTGALAAAVVTGAEPRGVLAVDRSAPFVAAARRSTTGAPVGLAVADASALPVADGAVDVTASGLVLNFLPDAAAAVREQVRVVVPAGTVAAFVWDYADGMQALRLFWQAVAAVDPEHAALDEAARFPLCRPETLRSLWLEAGLGGVTGHPLDVRRRFASFDELWEPFLGGQGPAGHYLAGLGGGERSRVADEFRRRLPVAPDGSVELSARAWAVRGSRWGR